MKQRRMEARRFKQKLKMKEQMRDKYFSELDLKRRAKSVQFRQRDTKRYLNIQEVFEKRRNHQDVQKFPL